MLRPSGKVFIAFYRLSRALEDFMARLGLLNRNVISLKPSFEMYLLNPFQMVAWIANHAGIGYLRALSLLVRMSARSTLQEKAITFRMQRIFQNRGVARALADAAPEHQPYRNEPEIRNLFNRLAIPIKTLHATKSCYIVEV